MQKSISASVCSFLWAAAAAIEEHTPVRVKTENWDKIGQHKIRKMLSNILHSVSLFPHSLLEV